MLSRLMTAGTGYLLVTAGENKVRLSVIESWRRLPALLAMAGLTLIAEVAEVLVEMTSAAARGQAEKCFTARLLL